LVVVVGVGTCCGVVFSVPTIAIAGCDMIRGVLMYADRKMEGVGAGAAFCIVVMILVDA